ncbi:MAG: S8 family serine peptidase, partial [Dehalobacter sp.]|nr:S8 family serine peptidase [Dehalobacter sp.]
GVTGKGVNIAIIDQHMVLDHPEFSGKVIKYMDFGTEAPVTEGSMHAPAVTSLLVGTSIGTAPDASIYFAATPSWKLDAQFYADALNWVIDENSKLPEANKIRVVSISAAPSGPRSPIRKNNDAWDGAYERAVEAGILVLDCTENHGITAPCYLDLDNPDDVSGCTPGLPGLSNTAMPNRIYIPTSRRTVAEEYSQGNPSYQYTGIGGLSWSIPYLAGVLAMGWQVNPELSNTQIIDLLFESAYTNGDGVKIINPPAFIELVKKSLD